MLLYTIIDQCLKVEFVNPDCVVNDMQYHFNFFVVGVIFGGLYNLYVIRKIHQLFASTTVTMQVLWHQRYDHINCHDLLLIQKQWMVEGLPMLKNEYSTCEGFALANMHTEYFLTHTDRRKMDTPEFMNIDFCGPIQIRSWSGAYYFLLFIDDCTKYTWDSLVRNQIYVFEYFKGFKNLVDKEIRKYIKIFRSNQGKEYNSNEFIKYYNSHGIIQ